MNLRARLLVAVLTAVISGCSAAGPATRGQPAQHIEVMAVWTGTEAAKFRAVLDRFQSATDVAVTYTSASAGVPTALATRLESGRPPDVAFLPQPGLLRQYATSGSLVSLDPGLVRQVRDRYARVWVDLASAGGRVYGVWFKAADKSLIWYSVDAFERAGLVPPNDLPGLLRVAQTLTASGTPAFAVGGADPWTLDDWFANLYLRMAGPERYDLLARHAIPWTDSSVKAVLTELARLLAPQSISGGVTGAQDTSFAGSVRAVASLPPLAAMVSSGDFAASVIAGTDAAVGVDVDAFPFPTMGGPSVDVVGGGDVAVLLRRSSAGAAFLRFLATPEAAAIWVTQGGFISPNTGVDLSLYPDALTRSMARSVLEAGDGFHFGLADLQPTAFGANPAGGMQAELRAFLVSRDVDATAARLEAEAQAAYTS